MVFIWTLINVRMSHGAINRESLSACVPIHQKTFTRNFVHWHAEHAKKICLKYIQISTNALIKSKRKFYQYDVIITTKWRHLTQYLVALSLLEVVIHYWLHLNVNQLAIHVQRNRIVCKHIVKTNLNFAQFGAINAAHLLYLLHVLPPAMRAKSLANDPRWVTKLVPFWFILEPSLYIAIFYCSYYIKPNTVLNWNNRK